MQTIRRRIIDFLYIVNALRQGIQDNESADSIVEYRICDEGKAYISQTLPLSGLSDAATIASRLYCTFFLYFVARSAAVLTPLFALKISSKQ